MADKDMGLRLKAARERIKKTQKEVCDLLDIPKPQTLSAYERGENGPPIDTLKKLSQLYQVSIDWFVFGEESTIRKRETIDCIKDLFSIVDTLNLPFCQRKDWNGKELDSYYIGLEGDHFRGFSELVRDLYKLYGVRDVLSSEEFKTIVQNRINDQAKKSNNFEPMLYESAEMDDGALPF